MEVDIVADDAVVLRARVQGPDDAPRLVMSHGNGLAIDGYEAYWSLLTDDYQVVTFDFRGHGRSDVGTSENHVWPQFDIDFERVRQALDQTLGSRPTVGVFHSLSALVSLRHAQQFGPCWDGLLLFDPPLMPPEGHRLQAAHIDEMLGLAARVARRQEYFASPDDLARQFRRSSALSRWTARSYLDMARATLRHEGQERWQLACPPAFEAKIFSSNVNQSLWGWRPDTPMPIKLVCADPAVPGVQSSALTTPIVAQLGGFGYDYVPDSTHFLQLEHPEACAAITRAFCESL